MGSTRPWRALAKDGSVCSSPPTSSITFFFFVCCDRTPPFFLPATPSFLSIFFKRARIGCCRFRINREEAGHVLDVAIRSVVGENRAVPSPERRHSYRGTPSLSSDAFGILWKNTEQAAALAEIARRSQNLAESRSQN